MRRLLVLLTVLLAFVASPVVAHAGERSTATPPTDPPITLPEGKSVTECVSSNPKPGCSTARDTDGHQLAVLGVIMLGMVVIGWRVVRATRQRDRSNQPV